MAFDHLTDVEVTKEFCALRDDLLLKYVDDSGRDHEKRMLHNDAIIVEHTLIAKDIVEPPTNMGHDFIYRGKKIDVKLVRGHWFTVTPKKIHWYRHCIQTANVDYFAFYRYDKTHSRPFIPGDTTTLRFIKLVPASEVMYNLRRSRYNGYYYDVRS